MKITKKKVAIIVVISIVILLFLSTYIYTAHVPIDFEALKDFLAVGFSGMGVWAAKLWNELKKTRGELENERLINEAKDIIEKLDDTVNDLNDTIGRISKEKRERLKKAVAKKDTVEMELLIEETKTPKKKKEEMNA